MGRSKMSFSIPLLSSVFGSLLPGETFKYIPLACLRKPRILFRLNKYAFFSSGYES